MTHHRKDTKLKIYIKLYNFLDNIMCQNLKTNNNNLNNVNEINLPYYVSMKNKILNLSLFFSFYKL